VSGLVVLRYLQLGLGRQQRIQRGLHVRLRRIGQTGSECAAGHGEDDNRFHEPIAGARLCRHGGSPLFGFLGAPVAVAVVRK
jgi:hypothetical protein